MIIMGSDAGANVSGDMLECGELVFPAVEGPLGVNTGCLSMKLLAYMAARVRDIPSV